MKLPHQLSRDTRPRRDTGAEMLEARIRHRSILQEFELGDEHGRDAVQRGALLLLDALKSGAGIEGFGWEDDGGAVGGGRHVAQDAAEAVEEGRGGSRRCRAR